MEVLPSAHTLTGPGLSVTDTRDITLSGFLDREEVAIDDAQVRLLLGGKRVLVTGAGGSIGPYSASRS